MTIYHWIHHTEGWAWLVVCLLCQGKQVRPDSKRMPSKYGEIKAGKSADMADLLPEEDDLRKRSLVRFMIGVTACWGGHLTTVYNLDWAAGRAAWSLDLLGRTEVYAFFTKGTMVTV